MDKVIYLKKNNIYFYAGFADSELTIPVIETWIYVGEDSEDGYLFQSVDDDKTQYCFSDAVNVDVLDKETLIEWLNEDHSPKKSRKEL